MTHSLAHSLTHSLTSFAALLALSCCLLLDVGLLGWAESACGAEPPPGRRVHAAQVPLTHSLTHSLASSLLNLFTRLISHLFFYSLTHSLSAEEEEAQYSLTGHQARRGFAEFFRNFRIGGVFHYREALLRNWNKRHFFVELNLAHVYEYNDMLLNALQVRSVVQSRAVFMPCRVPLTHSLTHLSLASCCAFLDEA
jgi:hypothetical protein